MAKRQKEYLAFIQLFNVKRKIDSNVFYLFLRNMSSEAKLYKINIKPGLITYLFLITN